MTEYAVRICDACAETIGGPRIATFIGTAQVSDICLDCATSIAGALSPADGRAAAQTAPNTSYVCSDCSRTFHGPAALGSHARIHKTPVTA